jgi:heme A synthase
LLGVIFFGGLWWTVRKGLSSKRPALCFFGSLLLRTSMFWLVFILSPAVIGSGCWRVSSDSSSRVYRDAAHRPPAEANLLQRQEASHAP